MGSDAKHRFTTEDIRAPFINNELVRLEGERNERGTAPGADKLLRSPFNLLDHELVAPFSRRIGRSQFRRAAENISYGHADFAGTLRQWTNSAGHRANLLMRGAKWIGVAHASNGRRTYWAMVIAGN